MDATQTSGRLVLGPSGEEVWHTFRLPAGGLVLGVGLIVLGLLTGTGSVSTALILGLVTLALSAALALMELRDLRRPWLSWTASHVTLGDAGFDKLNRRRLTVPLAQIGSLNLTEVTTPPLAKRRSEQQLWLVLRPLNWGDFIKAHPDAEQFIDATLPDHTVGLRASLGASHKTRLDHQLAASGVKLYAGPHRG